MSVNFTTCLLTKYVFNRVARIYVFRENQVNTIAADAMVPCISRSSAAMVLTMAEKRVIVFYQLLTRWIVLLDY